MTLSRRDFMKMTVGATTLGFATDNNAFSAIGKQRPNILFVFGDQWRRHALGFMKQDPVRTPSIDKWAEESLILTDAISARPVCSPYRATLMTGQYPLSNGVPVNCNSSKPGVYLRDDKVCVGDVLKEGGYSTGYIGKWHLDDPTRYDYPLSPDGRRGGTTQWDTFTPPGPARQGFDFWYSYGCCDNHTLPHYWRDTPEWKQVKEWSPEHETTVAIDFIERQQADKPFALFLSWNPPHGPRTKFPQRLLDKIADIPDDKLLNRPNVPEKVIYKGKTMNAVREARNYFAMIAGLDEQFARLTECLQRNGLDRNTIVVLTADHGDMMGSHSKYGKTVYYEESVGIPFVIGCPGLIQQGRDDLLFNSVDVMPTLLGLVDVPIPETVEGSDYSKLMRTGKGDKPSSALFGNYLHNSDKLGYRALRTNRYTFAAVRDEEKDKTKQVLYDLKNDPYQMNPIWRGGVHDNVIAQLADELRGWLRKTDDPFEV